MDVLVIDIAHGHSVVMERALSEVRKRFTEAEVIAGNVATADGARFLAERGASAVKVGIGPGGGCTTRMTTNFGVPQLQALVECRRALPDAMPLIADGGIKRHGALALALLFGGDTVMLGSAFAGTTEAPGEMVQKSVLLPESQQYGEGAVQGAARDGVDRGDQGPARRRGCQRRGSEAIGAEGMEVSVPLRGSARPVFRDMIKHLCSSISYGGAESLADLKSRFMADPARYLIRLTESSRRESYER